jgi:hypothetical protein
MDCGTPASDLTGPDSGSFEACYLLAANPAITFVRDIPPLAKPGVAVCSGNKVAKGGIAPGAWNSVHEECFAP